MGPGITFPKTIFAYCRGNDAALVHEVAMVEIPGAQQIQQRQRLEFGIVRFNCPFGS